MRTIRARLLAAASVLLMLTSLPAMAASSGDRLIAAVQDGLNDQVGALIAGHVDVNATDSAGATALAWAIMRATRGSPPGFLKHMPMPTVSMPMVSAR